MQVSVEFIPLKWESRHTTAFIYNRNQHIQSLDGWRAISILLVIFGHIVSGYKMKFPGAAPLPAWLKYLPDPSYAIDGVNVFFTISGFLITSLLLDEKQKKGTLSIKRFYFKRITRIFPVFYLYLCTIGILSYWNNWQIPKGEFVQNLLYLNNFQVWGASTVLLHTWSLSIEEQYYLTWPLLVKFVKSTSVLVAVSVVLVLVACISRWLVYYQFKGDIFSAASKAGFIANNLISDLFVYLDAIIVGALLALITSSRDIGKLFRQKAFVVCSLTGTAALYFLADIGEKKGLGLPYPLVLGRTIKSICFAYWMLYSICRCSWFSRVLNFRLLQKIGLWSYSIYIWQQLFLIPMMMNMKEGKKLAYNSWFNSLPQNIVLLLIIAIASYYLFERPIIRIRNRLVSSVLNAG